MTLYDVFSSRSQFSNTPTDLYCMYEGAKHIRITEDSPQNLLKFRKNTAVHQLHLFRTLSDRDSILSRIVPRCSCRGELAITGEIRSVDGWRTGFNLQCKQCGKKWTYSGGIYRQETAETAE